MGDNSNKLMGYSQICEGFRQLTDVRFKLLALVPSISGAAIALISADLTQFEDTPLPRTIVALLGLLVTIGIVFYDIRNSQLYNDLIRKARELEDKNEFEGPFFQRPGRTLRFLKVFTIWHDRGLALIYGSVMGAWLFPIICGLLWLLPDFWFLTRLNIPLVSCLIAVLGGVGFILELHRLDRLSSSRSKETSKNEPESKNTDT